MLTLNILGTPKRREALCPTCIYAVAQKGFNGEELTSCSLGGGLRELKFVVCECTAYVDRRVPKPERVVGFVQPGAEPRPAITVIRIAGRTTTS
ncbi:MAG TPA: hypothetical protein VGG15_13475 [Terriglobales bacterium]|jgi:hypothetical protein